MVDLFLRTLLWGMAAWSFLLGALCGIYHQLSGSNEFEEWNRTATIVLVLALGFLYLGNTQAVAERANGN